MSVLCVSKYAQFHRLLAVLSSVIKYSSFTIFFVVVTNKTQMGIYWKHF